MEPEAVEFIVGRYVETNVQPSNSAWRMLIQLGEESKQREEGDIACRVNSACNER